MQFLRDQHQQQQQNAQHLAFSSPNGIPANTNPTYAHAGFDLAQLLALQQAGANIRPQMMPPQMMNNNPGATQRNMLDMSQFSKMQFPQGGPKRD